TLRGWFFCLAFVSIGLDTNFRELLPQMRGGKPLILYVCGQSLNLCLTLLMAWLAFHVVFRDLVEQTAR
ncbi:MAG: putative sulfate exporter family transporter, partial [Fuerstiella sp.]|nr:putative sulfate exporter family transporter [Fuerstiella sp.]